MYASFHKLKECPFSITCNERFFYESSGHREALANMLYTVGQRKGMVLVTGEVGAGKTFLSSMLASRLGPGCRVVKVENPPQSPKQLVKTLAAELGVELSRCRDKSDIVDRLHESLVRLNSVGRMVALIVDESQDLPSGALEELRLLWNWEDRGQRLVQIILIGQPELRQRILEPRWEPLRQRIVLSYHLRSLNEEDSRSYIDHRIRVAAEEGCEVRFEPEAKRDIHAATNGIPRMINVICDNALLVAYVKGTHTVTKEIVREVLRDMTCWDLQLGDNSDSAPTAPRL
jgi:general secretion pathway protein A